MASKDIRNFYLGIVLPSILALVLFTVSVYLFIIPSFEKNMMERKKEMIYELTNTAWSLLKEYHDDYTDSLISLERAQQLAAEKIGKMRYGKDYKDYFWITDMKPVMIIHPYRKDLNGKDLSEHTDPEGTKLFVEAVALVKDRGEGYFDYRWQWKDDTTRIVPKLSYVKGFKEWGWIIGTGIYLEDVRKEIKTLENRLLRLLLSVTVLISLILIYIIRQSLKIENRRKSAEKGLVESREKYRSLVEASTEGTLMIIEDKIIFSNKKFNKMLAFSAQDVINLSFNEIFSTKWEDILSMFDDPERSVSLETELHCRDKRKLEVVISISKIKYGNQNGFIIVIKDVSKQKKLEKASENLNQELQTSLMLMNQPITHFIKPFITCELHSTVFEAAMLMSRKNQNIIFIQQNEGIIGVVNDSDLRQRVLAKNSGSEIQMSQIMTAPVKSIQDRALLYEAMLIFNTENLSHLLVRDHSSKAVGMIGYSDILNLHKNNLSNLVREINNSEDSTHLRKIHERIPVLINALLDSGAKTHNITRIISSVADAILQRLVELTIEEVGTPPCRFAVMVLGSEGRMEQTLATDQDNAIIFEDIEGEVLEKARIYFKKFGEKLNKNLDYIGYNYCKGEVMIRNPKYAQTLSKWKSYFSEWIFNASPQNIIDASIFFDFRYAYGNQELVHDLTTHIHNSLDKNPSFFYHFAMSVINFKNPNNLNSFNIKEVLLPFITFIKIYTLKNKLTETNSQARLENLLELNIIKKQVYDELIFSYDFLMLLRFRFQVASIMNNETPGNDIEGEKLTDIEKVTLKKIFSELGTLQTKLSFDFKGSV